MTARPFRVLGVQQIAVGGPDKARAAHVVGRPLGLARPAPYRSESENVDEDILAVGTARSRSKST